MVFVIIVQGRDRSAQVQRRGALEPHRKCFSKCWAKGLCCSSPSQKSFKPAPPPRHSTVRSSWYAILESARMGKAPHKIKFFSILSWVVHRFSLGCIWAMTGAGGWWWNFHSLVGPRIRFSSLTLYFSLCPISFNFFFFFFCCVSCYFF